MTECSIIVIAYHSDPWLPDCIASLAGVTSPGTHLVLVDNSGNTLIDEMDLSHFDAEVMQTHAALGFAAANNLALIRARRLEPVIVFLNQDTLSTEDWLSPCIEYMSYAPDVAAITPLTRTYNGDDWDPYFLQCAKASMSFADMVDTVAPLALFYEVPDVPAAAMVVRAAALSKAGPFDPVFGSYYEDYDLCRRMRQAGYRLGVCTGGHVRHFSGSASVSTAADRRRARWITRNRVIHRQRERVDGRLGSLIRYCLLAFPRGFVRGLLSRPGSKPTGPYLAAHWDLLKLAPRLVSEPTDKAMWIRYLEDIGWPPPTLPQVQAKSAPA